VEAESTAYPVKICSFIQVDMKKKDKLNKRDRGIWLAVGILVLLIGLAAAWKWTPLADAISLRKITAWGVSLRDNPARPLIILVAYVVGSLVMFPITILILATALIFGPLLGSAYSFAGCLLGAAVTYGVGYVIGKDLVQRLVGRKWKRVEREMGKSGVMAVTAIRLLPIAPFTIVNIVLGAFKVRIWDYFLGSLLGLAPGILVTNFFAHQFVRAIRNPGVGSYTLLGVSILVAVLGAIWLQRKFKSKGRAENTTSSIRSKRSRKSISTSR
jgi:phospholipase D1/2